MNSDKLTKENREKLEQLKKVGELEFNWRELEPVFRELIARINDSPFGPPMRRGPKKPTHFPDITATGSDGTLTTLEELMMELGYILPSGKQSKPTIKDLDLTANLDVKKPAWIPWWIWERAGLRSVIDKFLKSYVIININERKNTPQNNNPQVSR